MRQTNNEPIIRYRDPFTANSRRRRGGYAPLSYNDRSPEVGAMNAHLRASSYPEPKKTPSNGPRLTKKLRARKRLHPFLHLGHQYDTLARDNFIREAIVLLLLAAVSAWPIIHSVRAVIARW